MGMGSFEFTPEKSAERRQRLRDQLKQLDSTVVIPTPERTPSPQRKQLQFTTNFFDLCKAAAEIIKASGHRLELDGGSAPDALLDLPRDGGGARGPDG